MMNEDEQTEENNNVQQETLYTLEQDEAKIISGDTPWRDPYGNYTRERPEPEPSPDKCRARLWTDGLSVFGFNKKTDQAEVSFLRAGHYEVQLIVYENGCDLVQPLSEIKSTDGILIEIFTEAGGIGEYYRDENEFPKDIMDFRHMPNLAEWHGVGQLKNLPKNDTVTSGYLHMRGGVFYTYALSLGYAEIASTIGGFYAKKRLGKSLGADFNCKPDETLTLRITLNDGSEPIVEKLEYPHQYQIVVRTGTNDGGENHFDEVYKVLELPANPMKGYFDYKYDSPQADPQTCQERKDREAVFAIENPCETCTGGGGE